MSWSLVEKQKRTCLVLLAAPRIMQTRPVEAGSGSDAGFFLLKESFFLPQSPWNLIWCYINETELT